uniref:Fibronectin type-II domain-containing protein n=1 Tax=Chrysemys picta bellii TaxID=8478 RepID=A0A8C3I1P1_CHRPI
MRLPWMGSWLLEGGGTVNGGEVCPRSRRLCPRYPLQKTSPDCIRDTGVTSPCTEISPWPQYPSVFLSLADYDNGEACVFPFTYKGKRFSACTKFDNLFGRFWCATTDSYCTDHQWVFCADPAPCFFPFTYKGKVYTECTTEDSIWSSIWSSPWCATTASYDRDEAYRFCSKEGECPG